MNSDILPVFLVIALLSAGCLSTSPTTPTSTNQTPLSPVVDSTNTPNVQTNYAGSSLIQYIIKHENDRTITAICPKCGKEFSHNYTSDQTYICPQCGAAFKYAVNIALVKDGISYVPLNSITTGLTGYGVQTTTIELIQASREEQDRWFGTSVYTYALQKGTVTLTWSTNETSHISINGRTQGLSGTPFIENAEMVEYFGSQPPRYTSTIPVFTSVGTGSRRNTIIFVPVRDFIEPFRFRVREGSNILYIEE